MKPWNVGSSSNQTDTIVIVPPRNRIPVLVNVTAQGGNASDTVRFFPCRPDYKTVVSADAAGSATEVTVDTSDTDGEDVGGHTVTTSDFLVVARDAGDFIIAGISGVTNDAANDEIDLECNGEFFDGASNIGSAITEGNTAYVVPAADVQTFATADAQFDHLQCSGYVGAPIAVASDGNAAAAHYANGDVDFRMKDW